MRIGVYPGTFDPFTAGHLYILKEAASMFDRVYLAVLNNIGKNPVFTVEERLEMLEDISRAEGLSNVVCEAYSGLLVNYCREKQAGFIVRGLRNASDFEYESALDAVNRHLAEDVKTVYFMASPSLSYLSSSYVREMGGYGADLKGLVPDAVLNKITERLLKQ